MAQNDLMGEKHSGNGRIEGGRDRAGDPAGEQHSLGGGRYRELATKGSGKTGSQMYDGPFSTGAGACAKGDDGYCRAIQRLPET